MPLFGSLKVESMRLITGEYHKLKGGWPMGSCATCHEQRRDAALIFSCDVCASFVCLLYVVVWWERNTISNLILGSRSVLKRAMNAG